MRTWLVGWVSSSRRGREKEGEKEKERARAKEWVRD